MSNYTGYCDGFMDDGSGNFLCECDHVQDEHDADKDWACEFCKPGEAP